MTVEIIINETSLAVNRTRLEWAQWLADHGISIFIVEPNSKRPLGGHSWYTRQTQNPDQISEWFSQSSDCNYGCHMGEQFVVLDLDRKHSIDGLARFEEICKENGLDDFRLDLDTLMVSTPSGGMHLFFKTPFACANKNSFPEGIDVRGALGYVVGPGSQLENGEYEILDPEAPIADLPEWLAPYLEEPGRKDPKHDVPVTDLDQDENVQHAIEWLKERDPAIEGENGDDWTYETINWLRDFGLSKEKILEVLNDSGWNLLCDPPWPDDLLEVKIENSWLYGQNRPGIKAPSYRVERLTASRPEGGWASKLTDAQVRELFHPKPRLAVDNTARKEWEETEGIPSDVYPQSKPESAHVEASRRSFRPRSEAEQDRQPDIEWLIRGSLQRETLVLFYGRENSFKSFLVLDIVLCAAAGLPWASYGAQDDAGGYPPVRPLTTVYIAGEGSHGIERKRRPAWRDARGVTSRLPFYTVNEMPMFGSSDEVERLIADIREAGIAPDIIVVDTAARAMVGLDENSAKDTGIFVAACDRLKREFRCCVAVVHHSGKDDKKGSRGSTNLPASFDARFKVTADTNSLVATIRCEKQKDGDPWDRPIIFKAEKAHGSLIFQRQAPTGQDIPTADDRRVAEVRKALAACGGIDGIVSTGVLAAELARLKLDENPAARDKAKLTDHDRMAVNERRCLQRQAKNKSDGSPGLLRRFVVGEPTGGELSWTIPPEGDE